MSYYSAAQASREQDRLASNHRMSAVATALQGKYALVRDHNALSFIFILSADCLLNPGVKRLTAFDIHIAAAVYTRTVARNGTPQFVLSNPYSTFVAYDLVALFALPSQAGYVSPMATPTMARPQTAPAPQALAILPEWSTVVNALEKRANEPGMGGYEALPSVFSDEVAINNLSRAASQVPLTPMATGFRNGSRRESLATPFPTMARRLSSH